MSHHVKGDPVTIKIQVSEELWKKLLAAKGKRTWRRVLEEGAFGRKEEED